MAGMRRLRPFSPSFWGRAEDQAFALSMEGLDPAATLHMPYLVMQHDKDSFAQDAIAAAAVDKLIADHERILTFSAYGREIDPSLDLIGARLAPFTGAFVSRMPVTLAYLRLAVTTLSWAQEGRPQAARLFRDGTSRLDVMRRFVGPAGDFQAALAADRQGWDDFYDALDVLEAGLNGASGWAHEARRATRRIIADARIQTSC